MQMYKKRQFTGIHLRTQSFLFLVLNSTYEHKTSSESQAIDARTTNRQKIATDILRKSTQELKKTN